MPQQYLIVLGMGGLFIILGLIALMAGKKERKDYRQSLTERADLREFLERSPNEPRALLVGGWLAISVGLILAILGGVFWLWR